LAMFTGSQGSAAYLMGRTLEVLEGTHRGLYTT